MLPHLVGGPARHPAWAVLGVRRMPLAELADLLASLDREPAWWRGLYQALGELPAEERAELGALPVPLADGRLVRGPRGLLLPGPGLEDPRLAVLGLRVVDPEAAHPLLARLGAVEATPRSVLEDPATRAAVENSYDSAAEAAYDDDSPRRLADAVLGLLAGLDVEPGKYPWLAELALPGADGDWYSAGELLLPGAPLADVLAADASFGTASEELVQRHGADPLPAAGAAWTFGLLRPRTSSSIPGDRPGAGRGRSVGGEHLRVGAGRVRRRRRCRRPPPSSPPSGTWTSSTRNAGRRRSPCSPGRRCGPRSPSRPESACLAAPPTCPRTPPGGCAGT